ncbi:peptidase M56, BlaR1 [Aliikangiella marina]|uniref:Peptidase M56, BlaR1 n=1 Tax=Aliikangiella marina TaxID=1712262 RepID=A0A545TIP9_9GAMM|nr:M56 family metallopeptidase [Aliikangiella marina]TQV77095.1 peptidase M56, BlaR1 [Aliikangiella marina]
MLAELTLLSTVAVHHVLIGAGLFSLLFITVKLFKISSEMQSWLWLTALLIATVFPLSLVINDPQTSKPSPLVRVADLNSTGERILNDVSNETIEIRNIISIANSEQQNTANSAPEWNLPGEFIFNMSSILLSFLGLWLIGSTWRFLQKSRSLINTRKIFSRATKITKDISIEKLTDIPVLTSQEAHSPMTAGLFNPVIIVPQSLVNDFSNQQLEPLVLHELAHIQRFDIWFGLLQEIIAIIFWWSPIVRKFNHKIHLNREIACDIRAAKQLKSSKKYAQSLVDCAKLMLTQQKDILAMGLFSQKKDLQHRVEEVLSSDLLQKPKKLIIAASCLILTTATIATAQNYAPKINLASIEKESKFFSKLTEAQSEYLITAVNYGDINMIRTLVADGIDINTPVVGDGTALIIAVKKQNITLVEELIAIGADVNQASRGDGNPLITAAMVDNLDIAKLLLANGADINAVVPGDETPLINATRRGSLAMTKWLVENGADVNLKVKTSAWDGFEIRSPLNMARTRAVKDFLLEHNATE